MLFLLFSKVYLLFDCNNSLPVVNAGFFRLGITGAHSLKANPQS